jgi:hypothetical protein
MNELCLLTHMTSSDIASWAQAAVGSIAIVVGAWVVNWQVRQGRKEAAESEARSLDGIARLVTHLRDTAVEARAEKRKLDRWPANHPAEPSTRYRELADAIHQLPFDCVRGEVAFEALLNTRRAAREMTPLLGPEPELDVNPSFEAVFLAYRQLLDEQIKRLRDESVRLRATSTLCPRAG